MTTDSLTRLAQRNALADYKDLLRRQDDKLWKFHSDLERIREVASTCYDGYDYGAGYYYQSFRPLNIRGFRDTESRVAQLDLQKRLKGSSVLDIGSNTGFVLLSVADAIACGVGIEFNPYLVQTADAAKRYCGAHNVKFVVGAFEEYKPDVRFDAVLSLANHSTYDGNTKQGVESYFDECAALLNDGGLLIFESHPPQIEPQDKLDKTLEVISKRFEIVDRPNVVMTGFLDRDRTYVVARKQQAGS